MAADLIGRKARRLRLGPLLLLVLSAAVAGGLLYLRTWPPLLVVMTSSMEPTIETGSIVVMRHAQEIPRLGDIVAVDVPIEARQELGYPDQVLHRVISVTADGLIRTQGDNLSEPDPFAVPAGHVRGEMVSVVPGAGQLVAFLTSPYGLLWLAAGIFLLVFMPLFDNQRQLRLAIAEYGYHLRSHTEIVRQMAVASQELAATAADLRSALVDPDDASPASRSAPTLVRPETAAPARPQGRRQKGRHRR